MNAGRSETGVRSGWRRWAEPWRRAGGMRVRSWQTRRPDNREAPFHSWAPPHQKSVRGARYACWSVPSAGFASCLGREELTGEELNEHDFHRMSDEELIAHMRSAAGRRRSRAVKTHGHPRLPLLGHLVARAKLKVAAQEAEGIASDVMASAIDVRLRRRDPRLVQGLAQPDPPAPDRRPLPKARGQAGAGPAAERARGRRGRLGQGAGDARDRDDRARAECLRKMLAISTRATRK